MCGIAGIFRFDSKKITSDELKKLTDAISHRGPDQEGVWLNTDQSVGLGHRRLSILDLSDRASQPMHYAEGRFTIVYNGEIFNFVELRDELEQKGYAFKTDSDTEVLLASYHAWGKKCLYRFNGFWAFALWDAQKMELWLARDRFGIKPLYYLHQKDKQFVFGSETLQFKYLNDFKRETDESILTYNMQNCWGVEGFGKTIFKNINQVKPGHDLTVKANGTFEETHWWKTEEHLVSFPLNYDEQVEHFRDLITDAVKIRLRSDVPVASALSGGLDSSSVFTHIYNIGKTKGIYRLPADWQRAFIAVFPDTEQDERTYADQVLQFVGAKGDYVDCKQHADLPSQIVDNIRRHDCINASPELILDRLYGTMNRHGIKVSMDGHGVDEMMYGYAYNVLNAYGYYRKDPVVGPAIKDVYVNMTHPDDLRAFLKAQRIANRAKNYIKQKASTIFYKKEKTSENWFHSQSSRPASLQIPGIPATFKGPEAQLYHDFHYTTLPTILRNFDRGAMGNGVEIRMPFLDYRIVAFVFSLPMQSKIGNGFTKRILRDSMTGMLPEPIRTRRLKTGFNAPLKNWFQNELKDFISDEISSRAFLTNSLWNGYIIRNFVLEKTKQKSWTMQDTFRFWPVLNAHLLLNKN